MSEQKSPRQLRRPRIKTRFLILSDTHSALPDPTNTPELPFSNPFPPADVAIHSGDLTSTGKLEEHKRALQLLKSLPAPLKIVIPGNHDLTLDREYCEQHPILYGWRRPHNEEDLEDAHDLYTNKEASQAGIIYVVKGTHSFALPNGAKLTVYVSAYTPEFCDWGFAYPREVDLFNASERSMPQNPVYGYDSEDINDERKGDECMVMITHGPPKGVLDKTTRGDNVGCDHLMRAVAHCRPILHCFGHIHEGWGFARKQWPCRRDDCDIEFLDRISKQDEEDAAKHGLTSKELEERAKWQDQRRQMVAGNRKVLERQVQYADEEADVETRDEDPVALTKKEQESVGYIDASTVKRGLETVFVNASIMDVRYNPCQKPWIVDLMLPAATEKEKEDLWLSINTAREPTAQIRTNASE